jgi:diguanylate cyclase (GGDEF)-like protein
LASRNDAPLDQVLKRCLRWHDAVAAQLGKDALRLGADDVLPEALARLQRSLNVTLVRMSQAFEVDRLAERRALAAHQEQIVFQANHDALTGLPNRALIMDRIDALLARSRRSETVPAALFIDLDDFKNVNDTLGHDAGDRLLQAVAGRLKQALRGADTIGRMGGDEFVILIEGTSDSSRGEVVGERILEAMREPFHLDGSAVPIVVTTSAGIAIGHRSAPGDLLRDADVALYQAKAAGKNCWEVFGPEMESTLVGRYELDFSLRGALKNKEFSLVYQPIYSLDDLTLVGVEALIRWQHPTLGEIQPDRFVPLLESSGRILEVGRWVLREACVQMATWRARGSDLSVAVNVSGRQLDHDVLVEHVEEALETSGLEPAALTVEITETALMRNVDATAQRLTELKRRGVQLAIDDFGTGYSSLAYLQRFPVDSLKIDRAFTNAMTRSPESDALIHTFIQLGKDLGLKTLAEGVEHIGQIDRLRAEEVNEAQGFLFARPLDPAALEAQILEPARMISAVRGASAS